MSDEGAGGRRSGWLSSAGAEKTLLALLAVVFVWHSFRPAWRTLNTDFPNYYTVARLYRQGYSLRRVYDWLWIQRQKDHAGIDRPIITYVPLTLFSALAVLPLSSLPPLDAKRCWLALNLIFLALVGGLLSRMTRLGAMRTTLVMLLCLDPLWANFLYGQLHVLLLLVLTLAAWLYLRGRTAACGATLAVGFGLKIYPALFFFYFLRKKQWRAIAGLVAGCLVVAGLSILLFGYEVNNIYVSEILPRAASGASIDPYNVRWNSLTALLRRLFIAEPELNPGPLWNSPATYAFLQALGQALVFLPVVWLISPERRDEAKEKLDWASYVVMLLALSTNPASYHHCALILAAALGIDSMLSSSRKTQAGALAVLYALASFPVPHWLPSSPTGWRTFLSFSRLYAMTALLIWFLWMMARWAGASFSSRLRSREAAAFGLVFVGLVVAGLARNRQVLKGQFQNYAARLVVSPGSLMATEPVAAKDKVLFTTMTPRGYRVKLLSENREEILELGSDTFHPALAQDASSAWVEVAALDSKIVRLQLADSRALREAAFTEVENAEQPTTSPGGKWLAFIREKQGRGSLWVKPLEPSGNAGASRMAAWQMAGDEHDVLDVTFLSDGEILIAAQPHGQPEFFKADLATRELAPLDFPPPVRFPAVSPDRRWLAYSRRQHGGWQLWISNLATGQERQLTDAECNSVTPAWYPDSRTLAYATDCGRGVGLTALCRMRAIP